GLVHLVSMGAVIFTAIAGRHIIEAISWGLIVAIIVNLVFGLAPGTDMLVFNVAEGGWAAATFGSWALVEVVAGADAGVGGSLYDGALGFADLAVLILLVIAGAQI